MHFGAQPPTLTEKIKEVFGVSEVPNPESNNLGPNEVWLIARVCNYDRSLLGCATVIRQVESTCMHAAISPHVTVWKPCAPGTNGSVTPCAANAGELWFHQRHLCIRQRPGQVLARHAKRACHGLHCIFSSMPPVLTSTNCSLPNSSTRHLSADQSMEMVSVFNLGKHKIVPEIA